MRRAGRPSRVRGWTTRAVSRYTRRVRTRIEESYEVVVAGDGGARVFLTCEHASEHFPRPWAWHPDDAWLRGTHWAFDLGAANLTRDLAAAWGATAVLSRFSRLLADPNRPPGHPDLFRTTAEGQAIATNAGVSDDERERRMAQLYRPYHAAIDRELDASEADILFAIHSFTPVYEGEPRHLEVGVLYDVEEALATRVRDALAADGIEVKLNEPYSGKEGLIYAADFHAAAHARRAVELEVRQDLVVDDAFRRRLVDALGRAFFD